MQENWFAVYQVLLEAFGPQQWWPADSPLEVMVGAILTQNTAWRNVEQAIARLKASQGLGVQAILARPTEHLEQDLRPAGYFRVKAVRLRALCHFLEQQGCASAPESLAERGDAALLRQRLLDVHGIGEETADSILLYALEKPVMVVDAYTRRLSHRMGWTGAKIPYASLQKRVEAGLPPGDAGMRKELHALIVQLGKKFCRPSPRCAGCPFQEKCVHGRQVSH